MGYDRVFPYHKGSGTAAEYGYVWVTQWDSEGDAREFEDAYLNILDANGATQRADGIYVIEDGVAKRRIVKLGERKPGYVEIVSGLTAGEEIVVAGQMKLFEGAAVNTIPPTVEPYKGS